MTTAPVALVDVNNAYCSMERIFQPQLQRRGVLVVGSNDANIVARSAEVKALCMMRINSVTKNKECH